MPDRRLFGTKLTNDHDAVLDFMPELACFPFNRRASSASVIPDFMCPVTVFLADSRSALDVVKLTTALFVFSV
jgi:hypothetical protein